MARLEGVPFRCRGFLNKLLIQQGGDGEEADEGS